jgi:hypothetical protein
VISNNGGTSIELMDGDEMFGSLNTFGEDDEGELYAATSGGRLFRVMGSEILPVHLTHFEAVRQGSAVQVRWRVDNIADITSFIVERSTHATEFKSIGTLNPEPGKDGYALTDYLPESAMNYYRLVYTLADGNARISEMRTVDMRQSHRGAEVYTHVGGGLAVRLFSALPDTKISIYTVDGKLVNTLHVFNTYIEVHGTSVLHPGMYVVVIKSEEATTVHKWLKGEY